MSETDMLVSLQILNISYHIDGVLLLLTSLKQNKTKHQYFAD